MATPQDTRVEPPLIASEWTLLTGFLDFHRQTLEWKCAGLTPRQLATRAVPTSAVTLLGMLRHLAAVETGWLVGFGGLPYDVWPEVIRDEERQWRVDPDSVSEGEVEAAWSTWRAAAEAAREVSRRIPLDTEDRPYGRADTCSLRWILLHLIEEYARHNGHADLIREAIDGARGE